MGSKHDNLNESELAGYRINPSVLSAVEAFTAEHSLQPGQVRVLDWGCGRGRSVALFRELGYEAYGVEIDQATMQNGFDLFRCRGLDPEILLRPVDAVSEFSDGFFHVVFSEQVFEHVADLEGVAGEQARLTASHGIGIHCFPGSRTVREDHLNIPFIHWLPKHAIRKTWLAAALKLGGGPQKEWAELEGTDYRYRVERFYRYLHEKTFYRSVREVEQIFRDVGFEAESMVNQKRHVHGFKYVPSGWQRNGFPAGNITLRVRRVAR